MVNFTKDLEDNCLSEWKENYLDYKQLKQKISFDKLEKGKTDDDFVVMYESFDELLRQETDKINNFYVKLCKELSDKIENVNDKNEENKKIEDKENQKLENQKNFKELDNIRHYCLLNIIAFIKITKKRNKKLAKLIEESKLHDKDRIREIHQSELLETMVFFKSENLLEIYEILKTKSLECDTERLENVFNKTKGLLVSIQNKQSNFDMRDLMPDYDSEKWNDQEIHDYIQNKLGKSHKLEEVIEVEMISDRTNQIVERFEERSGKINVGKKTMITRTFLILSSLYAFLFGLDMMGSSFKALSGKNVGELFQQINNPIAGLIVGILVTVMLQSSSTTTSIIVSMVGADLVNTKQAIPLIMGANIGTSVTNTLVSHGHIQNAQEFQKAFSGATIHDIFNLMCVGLMLPIEIITDQFDIPFLHSLSSKITTSVINLKGLKFKSPLKFIVAPLVKEFISIDKNIIAANAKGCVDCDFNSNSTEIVHENGCWDLKQEECYSQDAWIQKYQEGDVIKSGLFSNLGDIWGGVISLFTSLAILCIALYLIVSTLHKIVLQGRGRGRILDIIVNVLTKNGAASILFGMLLTISVQSSSITTSTFTPLVGLSVISLEQMLPLTLGANLGTTCTAFIASLVTESRNAVQIALCHFLFNLTGVMVLYPIPAIRKLPIAGAKRLGSIVTSYKFFSVFYTVYVFVFIPLVLLGVSYLFNGETLSSVFGTMCIGALGYGSIKGFKTIENKHKLLTIIPV